MDFKTVHVQHIHLASDEWSSSGIMDKLAKEWLDAHKHLIQGDDHIACQVYEHAGWSLSYTLDSKGELMVIGSANDAAAWHGEKKEWRECAYYAKWEHVSPTIRR
jgi:hypothetical protein